MAQQQKKNAHVPKFGNWDNDGNVPYTLYFENARKGKGAGGKMINPNDPAENPEAFSVVAPSPNRSDAGRSSPAPPAPRHERRPSATDAPPMSPNPYAGSPYHRHGGGRGGPRAGGVGGYSVEQSPVHPHNSESGGYGLVANSVDRSRAKGGSRGNETLINLRAAGAACDIMQPTRGSAVPKFGDWDSNPASADGYTHIFNKVREEKQTQAGKPAAHGNGAARGNGAKQHDDGYVSSSKFSCFGWCK
ncbi:hypothetical protein U9M48_038143 [Paspalum notatum var. saurae]|uniref:RIN4 pathogenic type III effector avirulence factor Avr cleavage site domain-containing protein n=1 Tax=Paspalum notatum var. saurae TaxID=547442 RepID=A0AAQ3XA18_PASNO